MKIALIAPIPPDVCAFGVRILSSFLKQHGHQPILIFLPGSIEKLIKGHVYTYPSHIIEQILDLLKEVDLIGISFMTNFFDRAVFLTRKIKKRYPKIPLIWGGVHPSMRPEEGLQYADMVCIGEGEEALVELLNQLEDRGDIYNIQNLWIKDRHGKVKRNKMRPLIQDLDSLPFFDYELEGHFIYDNIKDEIVPMNLKLLKRAMPTMPYLNNTFLIVYRTITGRGCPHHCSYCVHGKFRKKFQGQKYLRQRSVENVIHEIILIKEKFNFIKGIHIFDDTFYISTLDYIKKFSQLYKEKINLPLYTQASPLTLSEEKMEYLFHAGMVFTEIGIQTGSKKIQQLYHRNVPNEKVVEATKLVHKYRSKLLTPHYHIILDNPWETTEDILNTLDLIFQIPRPYKLQLSSLIFYPGTILYDKAEKEGLIQDEVRQIYRKCFVRPRMTYLNLLIYLTQFRYIPLKILRFLGRLSLVKLFHRQAFVPFYDRVYKANELLNLFWKGIIALSKGDLKRIKRYLNRIR